MSIGKLNSCLYKARVMHHRLMPKMHQFHYYIFMFYLDLDELDHIEKKFRWISRNRFNLFNFKDSDHLQLPRENPDKSKGIREQIVRYLEEQGVKIGRGKIMLLTNLCTLGYQFNPVSFYVCYDENGNAVCSIAEVCNTFKEMKPYFLGLETLITDKFHLNIRKDFYVSPFSDLDLYFDFKIKVPGEELDIAINDYNEAGELFFLSSLKGTRKVLNDNTLIRYFFSIPMITLQIMWLIHWQALKIWAKQIAFHKKADNPELQTDIFRPYKS